MAKKINVLYLTHERECVYGSGRSLYNMIHSLGNNVNVVVIVPAGGQSFEFFQSKGLKTYIVNYPLDITNKHGLKRVLTFMPRLCRDVVSYFRAINEIKRIVQKENIHIIHSNSSVIDIGYFVSKLMKLPHVWHLREFQNLDFNFKPFCGWRYLAHCIKSADATICITKAIQKHFGLIGRKNSFQIFNAVRSVKDSSFYAVKDKYFILCGHLSEAKGCKTAIIAFSLFSKKVKGYRLKFVGSINEDYKQKLIDLAKQNDVDGYIDFLGFIEDAREYYEKASALLMCSKNEAMGRVTVEAMFYGCPVIGYNGGGTREIIQDNITGLLFNDNEECAFCMQLILEQNFLKQIVQNAHKRAFEHFSEERYGERILAIYQNILQHHGN